MANSEHFEIFRKGPNAWNEWRKKNPQIEPDLSNEFIYPVFSRSNKTRPLHKGEVTISDPKNPFNFSRTNFYKASFESAVYPNADFTNCYLYEADFSNAGFPGCDFSGSMLRKTYCRGTDFSNAKLIDCVLNNSLLINVNFSGVTLEGCNVFGVSVWDLIISENTVQKDLFLHRDNFSKSKLSNWQDVIFVDDLALAQFFYLINQEDGFGKSLKKLNEKTILLLGKFRDGGLELLRYVGEFLREKGFVPIIFDFIPNSETNLIENVTTMAGLSRFVFANLEGGSVPAELARISSNYNTPIIAWIHDDKHDSVYAMFRDVIAKENVQYFTYLELDDLPGQINKAIEKAEKYLEELSKHNAIADKKLDSGRIFKGEK